MSTTKELLEMSLESSIENSRESWRECDVIGQICEGELLESIQREGLTDEQVENLIEEVYYN